MFRNHLFNPLFFPAVKTRRAVVVADRASGSALGMAEPVDAAASGEEFRDGGVDFGTHTVAPLDCDEVGVHEDYP